MSSAALAYYYTGGATMTALPAISAFTTAAPNLYDGAIGDTATNNSVVQGTTGGGNYNFYAMIDLGPTPPAITKFTAQRYGNATGGMTLFYATSTSSGYTQVGTGLTDPGPYTSTFAAITARYWLLTYRGGGNYPATIGMTDFRLYDAAGSVILPPGTVANPQLPIGTQTSIPPTGTDAPTSLAYPNFITTHGGWEIANPSGTVIAWFARYGSADSTNGWYGATDFPNAQIGGQGSAHTTAFPLTPPVGTPIAAGYEVRTFTTSGPAASAFFDVVASLTVLRNQTRIVIY